MKSFVLLPLLILAMTAGCDTFPVTVVVKPIDANEVLDGEALTLVLANQPGNQDADVTPDTDAVVECLCGGTGRSGDGLGPCACPAGCKCKAKSEEPPAAQDEASPQVEVGVPSNESTDPLFDDDLTQRVNDLEARVEKLEQPVIPQTSLKEAFQSQPANPERHLIVITRSDGTCKPCDDLVRIEVPVLVDAGWSVGENESYQIILVDIAGELATKWPLALENAKVQGTPYFAFYEGDRIVKEYAGYTKAKKLADDFNQMATKAVTATKAKANSVIRMPRKIASHWDYDRGRTIEHLMTGPVHIGKYVREDLDGMSDQELVDLHDQDHRGVVTTTSGMSVILTPAVQLIQRGSMRCVNGRCFRN